MSARGQCVRELEQLCERGDAMRRLVAVEVEVQAGDGEARPRAGLPEAIDEPQDLVRSQPEARRCREVGREPECDGHVAVRTLGDLGQQAQLVGIVDHDRDARGDAQLQECARLDRSRHHHVCGRHVAREHLKQLPLAGDVDSQARAPGLVDERQRLVGLAGEEDLQIDAGDGGRVPELPRVAGERRRIQHVERRSVALDPLRKLLGVSAELDLPGLEAGRQRDDAFTARSHPGGGIGGLEVHAHAGARSRGPRRALSRYSSRQRCTIRRAQRSA